jgi:hypothetical protein
MIIIINMTNYDHDHEHKHNHEGHIELKPLIFKVGPLL